MALATSGCQDYVKKADFEAAIDELRANDEWQQQEIDELWQRMQRSLAIYAVNVIHVKGGIRVDAPIHFSGDTATLCDDDKRFLSEFSKVVSSNFPQAVVAVKSLGEGGDFGSTDLEHVRRDAVCDYFIRTRSLGFDACRSTRSDIGMRSWMARKGSTDDASLSPLIVLVVDFSEARKGHERPACTTGPNSPIGA
jgi:peptidoglycan-associated lipoprotein